MFARFVRPLLATLLCGKFGPRIYMYPAAILKPTDDQKLETFFDHILWPYVHKRKCNILCMFKKCNVSNQLYSVQITDF